MSAETKTTVRCEKCGAEFGCDPAGACWCMDEAFKVPMPTEATSCLCPKCLREMAEKAR